MSITEEQNLKNIIALMVIPQFKLEDGTARHYIQQANTLVEKALKLVKVSDTMKKYNEKQKSRREAFEEAKQKFVEDFHLQYGGTGMNDYISWLNEKVMENK